MSDYYAEFDDPAVQLFSLTGKYVLFVTKDLSFEYLLTAERVWWEKDDGSVHWVKCGKQVHLHGEPLMEKDLKEFVWVKLSAIHV